MAKDAVWANDAVPKNEPVNDPVNDPVLYEPVNALNELVNALNEDVNTNDPVSNVIFGKLVNPLPSP
jgi:hypothetical protein